MILNNSPAVLFDLDGTLLDSKPGIVFSFSAACRDTDLPIPDEATLHQFIGPPLPAILRDHFGIDDAAVVNGFIDSYRKAYLAEGMFRAKPFSGINTLLRQLGNVAALFVATSKPRIHAKSMLEHFCLVDFFRAVHGAELDGTRHDKAELLSYILRSESLTSVPVSMIGDRRYDMVGARANDVFAVGALWGYGSRAELQSAGAQVVCQSPDELVACLNDGGWL